ncbi:MAG: type IV pilus modification protein PilV, partial [Stenotrophomonas sp.]
GFALLQTMNVRFVQSANYRTQATNLAYDLLDQMRTNRYQAAWYTNASFAAGTVPRANCSRPTGTIAVSDNVTRWQCQVVKTLGDRATANVSVVDGLVTVGIGWGDERWDADNADSTTTFTLVTRL